MEQRTKVIIIIVGAFVLFGLLVSVMFDLFPGSEEGDVPEEQEVVLPDREEGLPQGATFEAGNADEFAAISPGVGSSSSISELEREARDLAVFFVERFGTYSSDARFAYIDDLSGFMTTAMRASMESFKQNVPERAGFYSISADLASIETDQFSLSSRSALFSAVLNRVEESRGITNQFQQRALITLSQSSTGAWLVQSVLWGERL